MANSEHHGTALFGANEPWRPESWVASDDRVRGGKSQSYLDFPLEIVSSSEGGGPTTTNNTVRFHGELDITALGGAGFASQRSPDGQQWDLSTDFEGLGLKIVGGDGKKYTLVIKDEILPKRPDGREQSTVSWEYDFIGREADVLIPWQELKPTYRGKPKPDARPLHLANIQRISIMMRSFFGEQEGHFEVELGCISAVKIPILSQS